MSKATKKKKVTPVKVKEKVIMKIRDEKWIGLYQNCVKHIKALKGKGVTEKLPDVSRKMSKKDLQKIYDSLTRPEGKYTHYFRELFAN